MSSWLGRIAVSYGLSVKDLLTHNLDLPTVAGPLADLDDERGEHHRRRIWPSAPASSRSL